MFMEQQVVILDMMLPDINGIEILKTIKASKGIPVIMLSGKDSPQLRQALADAKKTSEEKGATSKEAAVAWDIVEEIAAAGAESAANLILDDIPKRPIGIPF